MKDDKNKWIDDIETSLDAAQQVQPSIEYLAGLENSLLTMPIVERKVSKGVLYAVAAGLALLIAANVFVSTMPNPTYEKDQGYITMVDEMGLYPHTFKTIAYE